MEKTERMTDQEVLRNLATQMAELTEAMRVSNRLAKEHLLLEKRTAMMSGQHSGLLVESDGGPSWYINEFEGMPKGVEFTHQVIGPDRSRSWMFRSADEAQDFLNTQLGMEALRA
jgi:hypothetical protein